MSTATMKILALVFIIFCLLTFIFFLEELVRYRVVLNRKRKYYYTLYTVDKKPMLVVNNVQRQPQRVLVHKTVEPKKEQRQQTKTTRVVRRKVSSNSRSNTNNNVNNRN